MPKYSKELIQGRPNYTQLRRRIEHHLRNKANNSDLETVSELFDIIIPLVPIDSEHIQLELPLNVDGE